MENCAKIAWNPYNRREYKIENCVNEGIRAEIMTKYDRIDKFDNTILLEFDIASSLGFNISLKHLLSSLGIKRANLLESWIYVHTVAWIF